MGQSLCSSRLVSDPLLLNKYIDPFPILHLNVNSIVSTAYSPLGSGAADKDGRSIPTHPKLAEIGKERLGGKTAAQVAIAFQRARGVTVIPKSVNEARMYVLLV